MLFLIDDLFERSPKPVSVLSVEELREIVGYDPATGGLTWKDRPWLRPCVNSRCSGRRAGAKSWGYIRVTITLGGVEKRFLGHRIAWALMTGSWPTSEIDHIDRDGFNNEWSNLRSATSSQNKYNQRGWKKKSLPKGVFFDKRSCRFFSTIMTNNKSQRLGTFSSSEEAERAYNKAAKEMHGEFCIVN